MQGSPRRTFELPIPHSAHMTVERLLAATTIRRRFVTLTSPRRHIRLPHPVSRRHGRRIARWVHCEVKTVPRRDCLSSFDGWRSRLWIHCVRDRTRRSRGGHECAAPAHNRRFSSGNSLHDRQGMEDFVHGRREVRRCDASPFKEPTKSIRKKPSGGALGQRQRKSFRGVSLPGSPATGPLAWLPSRSARSSTVH